MVSLNEVKCSSQYFDVSQEKDLHRITELRENILKMDHLSFLQSQLIPSTELKTVLEAAIIEEFRKQLNGTFPTFIIFKGFFIFFIAKTLALLFKFFYLSSSMH